MFPGTSIDAIDTNDFDLNLVRTFVVLYETRSVTATGAALHVTQPTVSYNLQRLRRRFGDELFRRSGRGLVATTTAGELYAPLRTALSEIEATVTGIERFDPATATTKFTVCLSDLGETTLLPPVLAAMGEQAPGIRLTVLPLDVVDAEGELARGEIDAFIASPLIDSRRIARIPLFTEGYLGMVARDHPRLRSTHPPDAAFDGERYACVFGPTGHEGPDRALRARGLGDSIVLEVTRFSSLPYLVQHRELVALVPRKAGEAYRAAGHPVRLVELPFEVEPVQVSIYARHSHTRSAAQHWLLEFVHRTLADPAETG